MILYKPQQIWNVALFQTSFEKFIKKEFDKPLIFSPVRKVRTNYHYATGYADPFLFVDGEWLYLFYEEERLKAPASIYGIRTKDLKRWEKPSLILQEDFHLSFPNTFRVGKEIYMLPETREKEAVILYKSMEFPGKWEPTPIIQGDKFTDSSIIRRSGKWFLFTTVWYGKVNGLRIYFSDDLLSGWTEHPLSPVHDDLGYSRNGGAVFEYEGKLYRPAQNCTTYYGENLALYEIEKLSTAEFVETKRIDLIDKKNQWSKYGGHHFNMVNFQNKTVIVMDGITDDNWINNHTRKFFNYFHNRKKK